MSRLCLILFGPPGSGKGTQAKLLSQARGLAHISTGDMLRERVASGDALGREVAGMMKSGGLVSDTIVNRMLQERIERPDCARGFILDGYPRTVSQAELLHGWLSTRPLRAVVVRLEVDYNVIISRLSGRRYCPVCGALYNVNSNAPAVSEICDNDGSKLAVREDDREEVVRERLRAYERQTAPVLEYFKRMGYPCRGVEGDGGAPQLIAGRIEELIQREVVEPA